MSPFQVVRCECKLEPCAHNDDRTEEQEAACTNDATNTIKRTSESGRTSELEVCDTCMDYLVNTGLWEEK
jgi:hypothetical protein